MERILKPYEGSEKYIFISYSHRDAEAVFSIIARMQREGCRIWYDEGIDPGNEWDEAIATHIQNSALLLAFISPKFLESDNCKDELNFARDENINRILIYLDDVELPPGMKMRLGRQQAIYYCKYADKEGFYDKLFAAQEMVELKGKAPAALTLSNKAAERQIEKPAPKPVVQNGGEELKGKASAVSIPAKKPMEKQTEKPAPKPRPAEKQIEKPAPKSKVVIRMSDDELFAMIKKMCAEYVETYDRTNAFKCEKKMLRKCLGMPDTEPIFLGHDDTLLGTGKNGFIISRHGIYCKELMGKPIFTDYSFLTQEKYYEKANTGVKYNGMVIAYLSGIHDKRMDKLIELIKNIARLYNECDKTFPVKK